MPSTTTTTYTIPSVDSNTLVYHVNIFLLIVVCVFAVFNFPRAIVRFARRSERFQGHLLYATALNRNRRSNINTNSIYLHSDAQKTVISLGDGSTDHDYSQFGYPAASTFNEKVPPHSPTIVVAEEARQTWHMPMLSSLVPSVARVLHLRMHDNYSLGQILLMVGYTIVLFYAGLYGSSPFVSYTRGGWVSVSQFPYIYILATKNNVIGMLVGVGYEKLNYLHRFAGGFAVVAANVHTLSYIYEWSIAGTVSKSLAEPTNMWGLVALVALDMLGLFSLKCVRSKSYNLFIATHAIGFIVALFSVCYHAPDCTPYVVVATVFYGLDHLVRMAKTRITTATLRPIPELGLTRVEIPSINAGWRAGQHVRLRVLSTGMGMWGMTEVHPFTIASVSETEEGLVLLCKKDGRWTTKMYDMANTSAYGEQGQERGKDVKVMVEGPYGGVGNTVISSYSGALFIVGGSGVTFALSAVHELVRSGTASDVLDMQVVWSIADPGSLTPMLPLLSALLAQCTAARLRISVFHTRASSRSLEGMYLPPGITLVPGRPNMDTHLDAIVRGTTTSGGRSGVFVGVCGPVGLAASASDSVRRLDSERKRIVGGVEFHEEVFGW